MFCSRPLTIECSLQFGIMYELAERALRPAGQGINKGIEKYWSHYCSTRDVASNRLSVELCATDHTSLSLAVCMGALLKTLYPRSQ